MFEQNQSASRPQCANNQTNKKNQILFVGNMFYEPNKDAAEFIIQKIASAVTEQHPDVVFLFIGRTPVELLQYQNQNICFMGEVNNLNAVLSESLMCLAPLLSGSGMKVKMLTYAAYGLPVIGTSIALMGYDANNGFIIDDSVDGLIQKVLLLLKDPQSSLDKGLSAQDYVLKSFN